jgi:hypothetical protein
VGSGGPKAWWCTNSWVIAGWAQCVTGEIVGFSPTLGMGSHGDGGACERLRRVTQMVVTRELDSGPE